MAETQPPLQQALDLLARHDRQADLLTLRTAGECLDRVDLFAAADAESRAAARTATLRAWLQLLRRLDAAKVAGFDPEQPPAMRLAPAAGPGDRSYSPGTPPSAVADPRQRADYERALAANAQQQELAARHWEWQALDIELAGRASRFIRRYFTASNADQGELAAALAEAGTSPERRHGLGLQARRP